MNRRRGFTLLEVLVSMVVLTVGLAGAAGLLLGSLHHHGQAMRHAAATVLVADMLDRIRMNPTAGAHYDSRTATTASSCDAVAGCGAAQRAAADLAESAAAAAAVLPGRDARITVHYEPAIGPAAPDLYRIALHWRERASGAADEISQVLLVHWPVAGA